MPDDLEEFVSVLTSSHPWLVLDICPVLGGSKRNYEDIQKFVEDRH
jgi:hypothetical protein